jgi:hypothetical protein
MKYVVVSPRVGVPGTEYDIEAAAERGINVAGLIAGGFIKPMTESTTKPTKPRKVKPTSKE